MNILITGTQGSGKTTFLRELLGCLRKDKVSAAGILATGTFREGERESYSLLDIANDTSIPFISAGVVEGWKPFRRFHFNPDAWEFGEDAIQRMKGLKGVGIIDEIGPMELQGDGWARAFRSVLADPPSILILAIRHSMLKDITEAFGLEACDVWYAGASDADVACSYIKEKLGRT